MPTPPFTERRVPEQVVLLGATTRDEMAVIEQAFPGAQFTRRERSIEALSALCVLVRTDRERRSWGLPAETPIALVLATSTCGDGAIPSLLEAIERRLGGVELWRSEGVRVVPAGSPSPALPRTAARDAGRDERGASPTVTPEEIRMLLAGADAGADEDGYAADASNDPESRA